MFKSKDTTLLSEILNFDCHAIYREKHHINGSAKVAQYRTHYQLPNSMGIKAPS